jgi:hypothetical protein
MLDQISPFNIERALPKPSNAEDASIQAQTSTAVPLSVTRRSRRATYTVDRLRLVFHKLAELAAHAWAARGL